jgi:hypothetical protein
VVDELAVGHLLGGLLDSGTDLGVCKSRSSAHWPCRMREL